MNVLVTGHLGYIGTVLTGMLHEGGHTVIGVDTGFFEDCLIAEERYRPEREIRKDVRAISEADLEGIDGVVHLAALSNDPMGDLDPDLTAQINYRASVSLARMARDAGVARFVFSSSCSMYGAAEGSEALTEEAPFHPVSAYAVSKVNTETEIAPMATDSFSPVFLRNATAYGVSPRLRFDLVVNEFVGRAVAEGKILIKSDGSPWRPLVHVEDICRACVAALEAPQETIHNQAFNVGQDSENFQIRDIVDIVLEAVPGCEVEYTGEHAGDRRSYNVCFKKISEQLPGYRPKWTLKQGVEELYHFLKEMEGMEDMIQDKRFIRLRQLQHLMEMGQVDTQLHWKKA